MAEVEAEASRLHVYVGVFGSLVQTNEGKSDLQSASASASRREGADKLAADEASSGTSGNEGVRHVLDDAVRNLEPRKVKCAYGIFD